MAKKEEDQYTEFKESWREDYLKTIAAFANTLGGTLYVGKDDEGNVCGISNAKKLMDDIPNTIRNVLNILPEIQLKKLKGKDFLIVKVHAAQNPVSYRGKFFKRVGSTTQEMKNTDLQQFLLLKSYTSWEDLLEPGASLKDIDEQAVNHFKELASSRFPSAAQETSVLRLLEKLHLVKGRKLTRAALLLFGNNPQQFYPSSYIKVGRMKSDDTVLAMDEIRGNLFQQAVDTLDLLQKKYLFTDIRIEGLYRSDQMEIPIGSLREAIVNAIVHRDYAEAVSQIHVYPDNVVIWNNGELSSKLTLDNLKQKHASFPRNKLIAEVFHKAGLIEQWGQGTVRIIQECLKAGLPEPLFEQHSGGLQISFIKDGLHIDFLHKMDLTDRQIKAILQVKEYGKITNSEYQALTSTSKRTASTDLQLLVEKGILVRQGVTGKGTQYVLQRGNKGAKGATNSQQTPIDDLDEKINIFEKELSKISPHDEVRWHLDTEIFFKMFDSWIADFLKVFIQVGQKFNKFFLSPRHHIYVINGIGQVEFVNQSSEMVVKKLREDCEKYKNSIYEATITLNLNFGTFRKGGLKTFMAVYGLDIKLDRSKYSLMIDVLSDQKTINQKVLQFERLLHQPISKSEIKSLSKLFGETILHHLDHFTKIEGIR